MDKNNTSQFVSLPIWQTFAEAVLAHMAIFQRTPAGFFTETDHLTSLVRLLEGCSELSPVPDLEGNQTKLVHAQYPTPYKCDMGGKNFSLCADDSPFRRGYHDLVILNPAFVEAHPFRVNKGQDIDSFFPAVKAFLPAPVCKVGLELMYARDPFPRTRSGAPRKSLLNFRDSIAQDADKLRASLQVGFITTRLMLVFLYQVDAEDCDWLAQQFADRPEIRLVPAANRAR